MELKISGYSVPFDLDSGNDSPEILLEKAEMHNQKIRSRYIDRIESSTKAVNEFRERVYKYDSTKEEYELLLRQLTQVKSIYNDIVTTPIDLGCTINDTNNGVKECHSIMAKHLNDLIFKKIDGWIEVVKSNISKQPDMPQLTGLNLKSQFKNSKEYDTVIDKLIDNGNLRKDNSGNLIFVKCHRAGTKYGAEALRLVLKDLEYLKDQSFTNPQILELHSNTYKDFSADVRTLNNRDGISKAYRYFKAILS